MSMMDKSIMAFATMVIVFGFDRCDKTLHQYPRFNLSMKLPVAIALLRLFGVCVARALDADDVVGVRYGYFPQSFIAFNAACGRGWLDLARDANQNRPEYTVECFPETSGHFVASRLDNGDLDIAMLGSAPWAEAVARGLDLTQVYVSHSPGPYSSGVYVRPDDKEAGYKGIKNPRDLFNRTIGLPFGTNAHYLTGVLIKLFGLEGEVNLVDLSPEQMVEKWDKAEIDGAATWGSVKDYILNKGGGRQLISLGTIGSWATPINSVVVARRKFAEEHPRFMTHFVGIISRINDSFIDELGEIDPKNADRWDANQDNPNNLLASVADSFMKPGEDPGNPSKNFTHVARRNLDLVVLRDASTQLTCEYMGGGNGACTPSTGQHVSVKELATFLYQQKKLHDLGANYSKFDVCGDPSLFCGGGKIIDPTFLAAARRGNNVITPLGPYNVTILVDNERGGPDPVLDKLEELDKESNRSAFPMTEVGRAPRGSPMLGDSNCLNVTVISDPASPSGTLGDGANAQPGLSYSDEARCRWDIYPLDGGLVEVRLERLRLWSGDFVRIYSGGVRDCPDGDRPRVLLAQLSGMYNNSEMPDLLPPFRSSTCIRVEFESDGNKERGYAVSKDYGDGFEMSYSRSEVQECDCNGHECDAEGLCLCGGTSWGGDCSHDSFCLGTTHLNITDAASHVLQSSVHATNQALTSDEASSPYPNDLDCHFNLDFGRTEVDLAKVDVYYDIEQTFDHIYLQTGSGEGATNYTVLTGRNNNAESYYIPLKEGIANLRLTTDDKGRRRGFYAEVSGANFSSPNSMCDAGRYGSECEAAHCLQNATIPVPSHVKSQESGGVRAMPWAPDGGCIWEIEETSGDLRLIVNDFDLEPHLQGEIGDKLVVETSNGSSAELFVQECEDDDTCGDYYWQNGKCIGGGCEVCKHLELHYSGSKTSLRLVTDRNDLGKNYTGIDFKVHSVQSCPTEADDNCTLAGGTCHNGTSFASASGTALCVCSNDVPCDCSCTAHGTDVHEERTILITSIAAGLAALALTAFLIYRRRKKKLIKDQEEVIKEKTSLLQQKDAELEVFRLGESKFGDAVSFIDELLEQNRSLGDLGHAHKFLLVKNCLIRGNDKSMYVPENLTTNHSKGTQANVSKYLLDVFAGVSASAAQSIPPAHRFDEKASKYHCLPEFQKLKASKQASLFEALTFSNLSKWDFNIFDIAAIDEDNVLLFVAWAVICSPHSQFAMAQELGKINVELNDLGGYNFSDLDLRINFEQFCNYLREVQRDYQASNPYHNAIHAGDVIQTLNSIIQIAGESCFDKEELFSIFFSAAVHDVKHPGTNNNFQVNSMSDLALIHNDTSVLESEHASHAFLLLLQRDPYYAANDNKHDQNDYNFLRHVKPSKFAEIRKRVIDAVLHTDMSQHFSTVAKLKNQMAGKMLDGISKDLRWEILMFMLHLADISNPAKCSPMFELWTDRCLEEFFAQGDKEGRMDLPISPNCNRHETKKPDSQIGFIQFVVKPSFEVLASIIPEVGECIIPQIESNLKYWEKQKKELPRKESV